MVLLYQGELKYGDVVDFLKLIEHQPSGFCVLNGHRD